MHPEQCVRGWVEPDVETALTEQAEQVEFSQEGVVVVAESPLHRIVRHGLAVRRRCGFDRPLCRLPESSAREGILAAEVPEFLEGRHALLHLELVVQQMSEGEGCGPVHDLRHGLRHTATHRPERVLGPSSRRLDVTRGDGVRGAGHVPPHQGDDVMVLPLGQFAWIRRADDDLAAKRSLTSVLDVAANGGAGPVMTTNHTDAVRR